MRVWIRILAGLAAQPLLLAAPMESLARPAAPAAYSLPWQLRPVAAGRVLRVDETVASFRVPGTNATGSTAVTSVTASTKLGTRFAPVFRISVTAHEPPAPAAASTAVSNPLFGLTYARPSGAWRSAVFAAVTLPTGGGGGVPADPARVAAQSRAISARSAMDNALFAVNFWTAITGAGLAYVDRNFTAQGEATVLRLTKARGPTAEDGARTNFTAGLHLGMFAAPGASVGGELRMQRWLTDAAPVRRDPSARQTVSFAIGPRAHIRLPGNRWLRPGIAWARVLDNPLARENYDMLQLDVPLSF